MIPTRHFALLAAAMIGAQGAALRELEVRSKKRWQKPTLFKLERESRQVRRARERRQAARRAAP